ncbi:pilus assembly protein PilE [Noviherbaspirillum autotrophicum]|uniref:Pilus assembly protein PilE n=1 Tax=Noviherbaspirillum autotrophicum TaxID=709839 RepID=A0A0C1Y9E5_9BURK|nr:pilus assembly protein PilE [Noviherbaspirillum autotrophicum]
MDFEVQQHGFTLTDLMIALAIAGLLTAIAIPSYRESVRKSKRAEGRAALMQAMQQEERFYSGHNSYIRFHSSSTDEEERKFKWFSGNSAKSSAYEIKAESCQDESIESCVQLTAMPGTYNVDLKFRDLECGDLILTSTGVKTASSTDCWN